MAINTSVMTAVFSRTPNCDEWAIFETGSGGERTCRVTSLLLGLVTTATIVGNVFVMVAIGVERHLRVNVANYLIASLAVADLLVAALVMPLAAVNDVTRGWPLGRHLCDAWVYTWVYTWVSFDVLCCVTPGCPLRFSVV